MPLDITDALVAIIAEEAGFEQLEDMLGADPHHICLSVRLWETVGGLCRSYGLPVPDARLPSGRTNSLSMPMPGLARGVTRLP
jgi:uncharacterized protein with PIN domain